jgi:hypothetical protein
MNFSPETFKTSIKNLQRIDKCIQSLQGKLVIRPIIWYPCIKPRVFLCHSTIVAEVFIMNPYIVEYLTLYIFTLHVSDVIASGSSSSDTTDFEKELLENSNKALLSFEQGLVL